MDALEGLGAWLTANGESIYGTRPWTRFSDTDASGAEVRYTSMGGALYAIVIKSTADGVLSLPVDAAKGTITLLETGDRLRVERSGESVKIQLPGESKIPVLKVSHA